MEAALQDRDAPPVWEPRKFPDTLVSGQKVLGDSTYVSVNGVKAGFFFRFPPHVACIRDGKVVTREDLRRERLERQKLRLERKRHSDASRRIPVVVWVFYNDPKICPFYSGWYTYIRGRDRKYFGGDEWAVNFRNNEWDQERLARLVMSTFPLGFLPMWENFKDWEREFVSAYPCDGKPRAEGKAFGWATVSQMKVVKLERARS